MRDVVEKAQDASARIARKVTQGCVTSPRDDQSRRGAMQDPVSAGLGTTDCGPSTCEPEGVMADTCAISDTPPNPARYQAEDTWHRR